MARFTQNELETLDMFAAVALKGLMNHWDKVDEDGRSAGQEGFLGSIASIATSVGWDVPIAIGPGETRTFSQMLARKTYSLATAMMEARWEVHRVFDLAEHAACSIKKSGDEPDPSKDGLVPVVFVGGPLKNSTQDVFNPERCMGVVGHDGQYHMHKLVTNVEVPKFLYIWSEASANEVDEFIKSKMIAWGIEKSHGEKPST